MRSLRYGSRHLLWDFPYFLVDQEDGGMFYVFVEESGPVTFEGLTRPDEVPIAENVLMDTLGMRTWRIRASGVDAARFHGSMTDFEELDHDGVTGAQRQRRKAQLNDAFGEEPLPIFDLYVGEKDEDFQFLRAILVPGAWYWIVVKERSPGDVGLPIFVGAPELPVSPYVPGTLEFLETVPLSIEYRLRDIFSLVHVSDAEFGEETGGEGEPLPREPDDGPDAEEWPSQQVYLQSLPIKSSEA